MTFWSQIVFVLFVKKSYKAKMSYNILHFYIQYILIENNFYENICAKTFVWKLDRNDRLEVRQ